MASTRFQATSDINDATMTMVTRADFSGSPF
jgi:hypothetical protein